MNYIFVDFEMNPVSKDHHGRPKRLRQEIIEIGAVMLNDKYEKIGEYQQYVKPAFNSEITEKIETLTGITTDMVASAPSFDTAINELQSWCIHQGSYTIYAWSESDLSQVVAEAKAKDIALDQTFISGWLDFQQEFGGILGLKKQMSLSSAVSIAGFSFAGREHDALNDAANTAEIFCKVKCDEAFRQKAANIKDALTPSAPLSASIGDLFGAQLMQFAGMA